MEQTNAGRDHSYRHQGRRKRPALRGQQPWQTATGETNHRAHREVNPAGDNDKGDANLDNTEQGRAAQKVLQIVTAEKVFTQRCGQDADGQ